MHYPGAAMFKFLMSAHNNFNLANLITFANVTAGLCAVYYISVHDFVSAIWLSWLAGFFDILDGKIARKYKLSNEFGIQLDSFADFLSFVLVPAFLIVQAIFTQVEGFLFFMSALCTIYYIVSALRRLINFNIKANAGEVERYFTGIPTPLGAILLLCVYLAFEFNLFSPIAVMASMVVIGFSFNSKIKIKHL